MEQGEAGSSPLAGEKAGEEEDDFGYRLFPERKKPPQSFLVRSFFTFHNKCQLMLRMTLETSKLPRTLEGLSQALAQRERPGLNRDPCVYSLLRLAVVILGRRVSAALLPLSSFPRGRWTGPE